MGKKTYRNVKNWRRNHKTKLVVGFGEECAICKIKDDPIIYDFHHIIPKNDNKGGLSGKIRSWENTILEAKKCVMLCSHCHRKFHANMVDIPEEHNIFEEARVAEWLGTQPIIETK